MILIAISAIMMILMISQAVMMMMMMRKVMTKLGSTMVISVGIKALTMVTVTTVHT